MIIYLHGFASSGKAYKAQLLRKFLPDIEVISPDLPLEPIKAIETVRDIIEKRSDKDRVLLVGSSLGGFYAYYIHKEFGFPAVLLNPTVNPFQDLKGRAGINYRIDGNETFEWKDEYSIQLRELYRDAGKADRNHLYVYLNKDDEVLDYKKSEAFFRAIGCRIQLFDKGGHVFTNFDQIIPDVKRIYHNLK